MLLDNMIFHLKTNLNYNKIGGSLYNIQQYSQIKLQRKTTLQEIRAFPMSKWVSMKCMSGMSHYFLMSLGKRQQRCPFPTSTFRHREWSTNPQHQCSWR